MQIQVFPHVYRLSFAFLFLTLFTTACKQEKTSETGGAGSDESSSEPVPIPVFDRDTAYAFVEKQLSFGPRNPGSQGLADCREWMVDQLEQYGAHVVRQKFQAHVYDGNVYPSENLIAKYNPESKLRVILAAHYDTRFIAEQDADPARRNEPIMGADDGASGVGILLEVARLLQHNTLNIGVDLIFFDAEDQGTRDSASDPDDITWCLGSQYWSKNLHQPGYKARFGILLDMVGSKNAFFNKENVTNLYDNAHDVHALYTKVWNLARAMGKGRYFQDRSVPGIIDDHYFVNKNAGITMIDIINKPPDNNDSFGAHWHTHQDDIDIIDRNTLGSVGQVVTAVIYRTASGNF